MIRVEWTRGDDALARVYVGRFADGACVEFAESVQPPEPRDRKWVLIVSTLRGCPVGCPICDAGGDYRGKLSADEILAQVDRMVLPRFPDRRVPIPKFKIQFARMGEPALNDAVLDALRLLPGRYDAPGLMPSVSTVAPAGRERFFDGLIDVKRELYPSGRFQMQFSLHTTDEAIRRRLVPIRTWSFDEMAAWGGRFLGPGDRKITLNFAPARGLPLDPAAVAARFDPARFLVKLTPINPTFAARKSGLEGLVDPAEPGAAERVADDFRRSGFETIVSIGETRENEIGSNCGMHAAAISRAETTA